MENRETDEAIDTSCCGPEPQADCGPAGTAGCNRGPAAAKRSPLKT